MNRKKLKTISVNLHFRLNFTWGLRSQSIIANFTILTPSNPRRDESALSFGLKRGSQQSARGETMAVMTMTKMINNDNKLYIILGVLHLSYHSGTTLKREEQYHDDN